MKCIWIFNHYATNMFFDHAGRHYWFAKYLIEAGHDVRVFCASTIHNASNNLIQDSRLYIKDTCDGIPFVFVRTRNYQGNGKTRVLNMIDYFRNVLKVAKEFEEPDIIIGSSVHPLACVAAIKLGKRYACKAIVEIRDLWPETFLAMSIVAKNHPILPLLYAGERWIYKKADSIIFTMEGGKDYIIEKGWDTAHGGPVDLDKVHHINNGIDLDMFEKSKAENDYYDDDLENSKLFKVVYAGSIRSVNQVEKLVDVATILKSKSDRIKILLWGSGDQCDPISERIRKEGLNNIVLKGRVPKKTVPQILTKSDLNVYILENVPLYRFGLSLNKSFEYFAAGKPLLASANSGYSIIDRYQCGICLERFKPEMMADEMIRISNISKKEYERYCQNAKRAAQEYDFKALTKKLLTVIESRV